MNLPTAVAHGTDTLPPHDHPVKRKGREELNLPVPSLGSLSPPTSPGPCAMSHELAASLLSRTGPATQATDPTRAGRPSEDRWYGAPGRTRAPISKAACWTGTGRLAEGAAQLAPGRTRAAVLAGARQKAHGLVPSARWDPRRAQHTPADPRSRPRSSESPRVRALPDRPVTGVSARCWRCASWWPGARPSRVRPRSGRPQTATA